MFLKYVESEGYVLIAGKFSEISGKEIDYPPLIRKLRMKVGCIRRTNKTKTGEMNIVRNQP